MTAYAVDLVDTGLEVIDLTEDAAFARRQLHTRDATMQMEGMRRLARAFVERPDTLLQELVNAAVELCGADSAGISIQRPNEPDERLYHWVATAGTYSGFLDAILPRHPSACGICLDRGRPQLFRVGRRFFEILGVEAPLVTDGILLPWKVDDTQGTIFVMAHERDEAFDRDDVRMMQMLADFAALGVRQQRQQHELFERATAAAELALVRELAHQINNPLQSLTNGVYLTAVGKGRTTAAIAQGMVKDVDRLSALVQTLLKLPVPSKNVH
jgi:signal transduction histidine kinase